MTDARCSHPDEPWTWGTCMNWSPGWGDECGPDKHFDEAANILRRLCTDQPASTEVPNA